MKYPPSAHPPRRQLAFTSLVVIGLHAVLLGSPLTALSRVGGSDAPHAAFERAGATPSTLVADATSTGTHAPAAPTGLRVRIWTPPLTPQPDAQADPHPSGLHTAATLVEAALEAPNAPAISHWTLVQASTESEQSLRSNSTENKVISPTKVPNSARMQFDVLGKIKGFGYTVSGELLWQQDGRQYQSRFEIGMPLLGSRIQTSQGQIGAGGLLPTRFGDKVRSEQAAHFERDKGLISFSANTPSVPLEPGAQDRLSLFMQLSALLAGAPQRYPTGTQITLQTVSAREAEPWTFRVDGPETLQLPLGPTPAVRLTRLPRQPHDQQVDLWFAPSQGYLPVRLRVTHPNGDVADQVLRRLDPP